MLLAIDCGNTNVVFALYDGDTKVGSWRISSDTRRTIDEYGVWFTQLLRLNGVDTGQIDAAIIASVVPTSLYALKRLCTGYYKVEPMVVGEPPVQYGIELRVDRPEQVGVDRVVNAIAGFERYGGPLITIDFGTGATFDVVADDGAYEGGIIAPGINLSVEALYMASAMLPRVAVQRPERVIGKATIPAMQSGIYWGYVGMIEGLVSRIKQEYGRPMTVVATGGLAPLFTDATDCINHVDRDLTLRGLVRLYHLNRR